MTGLREQLLAMLELDDILEDWAIPTPEGTAVTAPVYLERPLGIDRSDDPLLSLDDATDPFRTLIARSQWYFNFVTGMPHAPIHKRWSERMYNPRSGDLVYVPDRILGGPRGGDLKTRMQSFGYYVLGRMEPAYSAEDWEQVKDEYDGAPCPTEDVFYVQYGPSPEDVCRWGNATCHVIATAETTREVRGR